MLGAMPLLDLIMQIISQFDFGKDVKANQQANDRMMKAFLDLPTFSTFMKGILVLAIIPAFGEELFFRGVLMRLARNRTRSMVIPIVFTAVIFSLSHTNIYGDLSIFLAGVLLSVIYYLTGSLWCSIVAHLAFNGSQVILSYLSNTNQAIKSFVNSGSVSYVFVGIGAVVFAVSFYLLWKHKTPMEKDWAEDFENPSDALRGE
jgi:membrane protease YdiL (CAAX protease family)